MYRVLLERAAEKDLSRLPTEIHDRVIEAIQALAANPRPVGSRKLTGSKHDWRIRAGDYRVVYENRRCDSRCQGQPRAPSPRSLSVIGPPILLHEKIAPNLESPLRSKPVPPS
jgi:mRNA interferase RelE/StbE